MFEDLLESAWLGPLLWAASYVSDYLLTLSCARMYRAQEKIVFEGSYEITALFQADVDALRRISPRFLAVLVASTAYLSLVRSIAGPRSGMFDLYIGVLGAMLLTQTTVHIRHFRNWFVFKNGLTLIQGRLAYPRGFLLRMSAFELLLFSGLYLGLFLVTTSVFVLGGTLAVGALSLNHLRLARRHDAALSKAA